MKKLLLSLFICLFTTILFAQQPGKTIAVKGTVIDSATNKPLGFVTISLSDATTKAPVKSSLTKDEGTFEIKGLAPKPYLLSLVYVGYNTKTMPIAGTADVNIGQVVLSPSNSQLKEVAVTALKPLMKQEVDRLSYDVQADPESKALSALDMMRKVPLLAVDASDNIKMKGSSNYKILINGKESALVAKNPSDVLKAMPATNIQKIEVITTPPAKYDAEGLAGIINIITKKNADEGYNVGINGRMNSVWGPGLNVNGNVKQGKFGMSAYAGFGQQKHQQNAFGNTQDILLNGSSINQQGINAFGGNYRYGNAELSYEIDSLNLITGSIEAFGNTFNTDGDQTNNNLNSAGKTLQYYHLMNNSNGNFLGLDAAVNYQLGFRQNKDQLLTLSYKFSRSPNSQFTNNDFLERVNYAIATFPDYRQYNNSGNNEHTIQLDYAQPMKKWTIEAGAKAILRDNFSEYHREDEDATGNFITNPGQTNDFSYHQNVLSAYNSYQLKLEKWTGKAGLRLEHTGIDANFASVGSTAVQDYNNFIPSVSVQRTFKSSSVSLGFTQRIQRPGIGQLNPFVDRSNPKFISTGNTGLRPELSNTFELNYSRFGTNSFNAGLSYAFSNNAIQNVSSLDIEQINGKPDTVTTTTYQNLGTNKTLGLNVNMAFTITKALSASVNGQLNKIWLAGQFGGQNYKNSGFTGNAFGNVAYKFDKGYRFGIDAGYFTGDVTLQGNSGKFIYSSYVLSKEFLNKAATISLVANNPYSKYQYFRSSTNTAQFVQESFNQNYYRSLAIRFNYKFGKLNSEIKRNQHGISNDDTKGGSSKGGGGNQ